MLVLVLVNGRDSLRRITRLIVADYLRNKRFVGLKINFDKEFVFPYVLNRGESIEFYLVFFDSLFGGLYFTSSCEAVCIAVPQDRRKPKDPGAFLNFCHYSLHYSRVLNKQTGRLLENF